MTAFPHSRKLFGHTTNIRVSSFFCVLYSKVEVMVVLVVVVKVKRDGFIQLGRCEMKKKIGQVGMNKI